MHFQCCCNAFQHFSNASNLTLSAGLRGAKVAVILDSAREFQDTTSDLNHGRVETSSINQDERAARTMDCSHEFRETISDLNHARTHQTGLHHSINRDERACVSIPETAFLNLKPASTVSSRAKWFKSEVVSWNSREKSNITATLGVTKIQPK
jgi:hypothetical protein